VKLSDLLLFMSDHTQGIVQYCAIMIYKKNYKCLQVVSFQAFTKPTLECLQWSQLHRKRF